MEIQWTKIFLPEIKELIETKDFKGLRDFLRERHPADIVDILRELNPTERVMSFRLLDKNKISEVFALFEPIEQEELLKQFTEQHAREILIQMQPDDRTQLFDELPAYVVERLLKLLPSLERKEANELLNYPHNSAGRIMTPEYVDLQMDMTVGKALEHIRKTGPNRETIYICYIVDETKKLRGVASLKNIILANTDQLIKDIMNENVFYVHTTDDQEKAAQVVQKYDILAVPVVDNEDRLVGIVTVDDILDVVQEEATEDFQRMAGIQTIEEEYFRVGFTKRVSNRISWLVILVIAATISQTILRSYSGILNSIIALTYFIPMLTGSGGNTGSQSSTLIIRALATGEIKTTEWWRIILREFKVGVALGLIMGIIAFTIAAISLRQITLALTVGISLSTVVCVGNIVGIAIPLFFRFVKLDPAFVSAPLIATLLDATGLLIYFEIARRIFTIAAS
ncbi:MAG: magnesium transporter [Candidatus Jettenia sp.]|uniref:Magnesium transporter MgtE n=1 Tax=Candidatus Jettenia caeni TaxID=247490 RepID=I3IRE3_9BACT|nr:magnesium transporter [Candidatus Jettenia sp. AMX1]MBC6929122.1 magnesium transporter [Candidatus Jettenia sp.]NUN24309.1 magnesium transporter [Candidatus Jettenia caeni]KAA0249576.1 MAG: magnesium transporter [Candidatus Jettenia sp. AMX1]MCE7880391.1 magnesium transporter [Candidatus Jettenia sp. AMX1]MCQ3927277.1 magnesium transporter [Candidatus Jettenia sp.]